jgi:hypothetical protein
MVTGTGAVDITGTEMDTGLFRRHAVAGRRDTGTRLRVAITGAKAGGTDKTPIKSRSGDRDFLLPSRFNNLSTAHIFILVDKSL